MASRTTTDPIEILLEMGVDLDNLSSEEDYLSALMEAAATIEFQTKGSGDERSAVLRKEIIEVRKKRKAADPKFKAKTTKISKSSFKPKAKPSGPKALPTRALVPYKKPEEEKEPKSEQKKEKIKTDKSQGLLESILKNVVGIKELLKKRIDITKSIRDIERKNLQKQKRKAKEDRLEEDKKGKNFLKKLKGAVPRLGVFDMIFNWIKNVIMGKILVKIIDWMGDPKNKKKLESLGRFLKDWWPALTAAFVLFATPLGGFIRAVVSGMARLTLLLLNKAIPALLGFARKNPLAVSAAALFGAGAIVPALFPGTVNEQERKTQEAPGTDEEKIEKLIKQKANLNFLQKMQGVGSEIDEQIKYLKTGEAAKYGFSGGGEVPDWLAMAGGGNAFMKPMGTDTVPAMLSPGEFVMSKGAVDTFGSDFMEGINSAGGGTNKPKIMSGTTYAAGGGSIIANNAKTTYYDPSLGGINASGAKTADGLPATSTGEAYKPNVFSAAAFPPLIKLLPSDMTTPTQNPNWGGIGKTIKKPFQVVVTKGDKSAVVRVNDVGPGVEGHSDNHMLDFSVATKDYLGTGGGGYTIHMAKNDAPLGPITGDKKITDYTIEFKGKAPKLDPKGPVHPLDDNVKIPDNAGTDALGNRNYGLKPGMSDTVGHKGKNYHFTKTEDGWKVTDGGFYGMNKQPVDPTKVPGLVKAFHEKHGHRGTGRNRDGSDKVDPNAGNDTTTDTTTDSSQDSSSGDTGKKLPNLNFKDDGAYTDVFAGARSRLKARQGTYSSPIPTRSFMRGFSDTSSSSSSSPSPKIDSTKVTNNPTNLTTNVDFNLGDVELDPTMQLKDLPGGMDANQLAREHAKTKQLSPEQTEMLAKQAVKFTKKNGRAPTKSEINKLTVNIFGSDAGKKVTDPETLKLIDEEKNINKSKLTPIPLDKVAPTDKLKPTKKDTTQVINAPPDSIGHGGDPSSKTSAPEAPDFPTVSGSREAREVRASVMANTLGGDFG